MAERNAKGNGSVRQRPDGRWEGRCTINGKRRSFYGDKQADVLKEMREAQKKADDHTYCDPKKMTFGEWLDIWLEEYSKPTIKRTSYRSRKIYIDKHIKPALGKVKLQSINTTQIQTFYNKLLNVHKMDPYGLKTGVHATVTTALNQAVKLKYITVNPATACTLPKKKKRDIKPFTKEQISQFLEKIGEGEPYRDLFVVALFTGMRQGELIGLSWDAVDFQKGTITIRQQVQGQNKNREGFYIESPKNGKDRTIFPAAVVMQTLRSVRREQLGNQLKAGAAWENKWNLVFTNKVGQVLRARTIYERFKRVVNAMGLPDMRFHDLRHTYAVMALQAGDDPKTVQNALGHHTAAFTLEIYAHVTEDMNRKSAERMQEYYDKLNA